MTKLLSLLALLVLSAGPAHARWSIRIPGAGLVRDYSRTQQQVNRVLGSGGARVGLRQRLAIWRAHRVGYRQTGADGKRQAALGNYSLPQLLRKARILRGAGIGRAQTRALMQSGTVGLSMFAKGKGKKGGDGWVQRNPKRKGSGDRQQAGDTERNVGGNHGHGEDTEHSRVPKGGNRRR